MDVATLALLNIVAGGFCVIGSLLPMSNNAPVHYDLALAAVGWATAVALVAAGQRTPRWALEADVAVSTVLASVLVSQSGTNGGQLLTGFIYTWVAVYCVLFFSPRMAFAQSMLITVGFGTALLVARLPAALPSWLIVSTTVWVAVGVMGRLVRRLQSMAETDLLTGLLNRHGFRRAAEREHAIALRTGDWLMLAVIDLDDFKLVNDRDGHAAGDRLLEDLSAAWSTALRPTDLLGRYGGDEFVLLLPSTMPGDADRVLERLRATHEAAWTVGLETWMPGEPLDACIARADGYLYDAKAARREGAPDPLYPQFAA